MPLTRKSVAALLQRLESRRLLRLGYPSALNWFLLAYAVLAVGIGWAYTAARTHADYQQTREAQRSQLREVTAALQSGTLAMFNAATGAALAAAAELQSSGGIAKASGTQLTTFLQKQLTGGFYVRFLFLAADGRFALASREHVSDGAQKPGWLTVSRNALSSETWVGKPVADPERPGDLVIPVARRVASGDGSTVWAGGLLNLDDFDDLYRRFLDQVTTIAVVSADGIVLARAPKVDGRDVSAGTSVASSELYRRAIAQGNAGTVEGYGPTLKADVVYAYDLMNDYPVYVVAGQTLAAGLEPWRNRRRMSIAATAGFSALVLVMTALLNHYMLTLRRRELHYRALFNNAQFSVFLLEGQQFVAANRTAVQMFGLDSEQAAVGLTPWQLSPEHQPGGERSEDLARVRIETALNEGGTTFEWLHKRADTGATFPAEVDLSSIDTGNTVLALGVVHDVTLRKRAEQDLRMLSAELMRSQDEERRRIGRDLHDSTGQSLAALELGLAQLMHDSNPGGAERRELLEHCARLATLCSTEIRTASYLLHPPLLDELGLLSALRWLADGFRQRSAIEVRLDLPTAMERLPRDDELSLFRVAQEALTNIHRHADSPWAAIRLKVQSNSLTLEVEDAGRGLAHTAGAGPDEPSLGVGLAGMRERIRQIGGVFSVESTGAGTRVRATVAVSARAA